MSWLSAWWSKPALKIQDPENSRATGRTWAGRDVGVQAAMQLSTFWSCCRLISETVATLPLQVFERQTDGSKAARSDHWLYDLVHDSPNADLTAAEFWEGVVLSLCVHGNAFAIKDVASNGRVISLNLVPFEKVTVRRDERGALRYGVNHRGWIGDFDESRIFHVRGFGPGEDVGLSPVSYARQTLSIADGIGASVGATFRNGMRSSVFFTAPQGVKMTPDQRKAFKETFIDPYVGADAAAAGLLEHGFTVNPVSLSPHDAEMLLSWRFSVEDICRWLRVPPILIGHAGDGQTMWGSGVEQIMLGWLTLGLRPYLTRIEQAIKKRLLPIGDRGKIYAEFNVEGLLRADSAGRAALMSALVQNGLLTRNEGRAMDNRAPQPGGDGLTVQSNLVPLDMLGKVPARAVQPAPGEPV